MKKEKEAWKAWQVDYAWSIDYPEFKRQRIYDDIRRAIGTAGISALMNILYEHNAKITF